MSDSRRRGAVAAVLALAVGLAAAVAAEEAGEGGAVLSAVAGGGDFGAVIPAQFGGPPFFQPGSPPSFGFPPPSFGFPPPSLGFPPPSQPVVSAIFTRVFCKFQAKVVRITHGGISQQPPCPSPH